jgi:hypothetical protein
MGRSMGSLLSSSDVCIHGVIYEIDWGLWLATVIFIDESGWRERSSWINSRGVASECIYCFVYTEREAAVRTRIS